MEITAHSGNRESRLTFDWTKAESMTTAIVDAVATVTGEGPLEMDPLYSAVDFDSLDALLESDQHQSGEEAPITEFSYNGVLVQVCGTGKGHVFAQR